MYKLIQALNQGKVIAYPTESVFGLGCDPDHEMAVKMLLAIKRRSWKKGLILVAANYDQLTPYIDDSYLSNMQKKRIFDSWPGHITWIMPAKISVPIWLTGTFSSLAVRFSYFAPLRNLCLTFGKAIVSTSANISGDVPACSAEDVNNKFGCLFPIMLDTVGMEISPSKICDAVSGTYLRI